MIEMSAPARRIREGEGVRERPRSGLKWLKKQRSSESLNSLKTILIFVISVSIVYLVIVTAIGQNERTLRSYIQNAFKWPDLDEVGRQKATDEKVKVFRTYYYISGGVAIFVMVCSVIGVVRESPIVSMIAAMFCLLAVAQSISSNSSNFSGQSLTDSKSVRLHSPVIMIALLGSLLTVYTALIWSSEFETPPQIKEEYKWYLDQLPQHKSTTIGSSATSTMSGHGNNQTIQPSTSSHQSILHSSPSFSSTTNRSTDTPTVSTSSNAAMIMASDLNH